MVPSIFQKAGRVFVCLTYTSLQSSKAGPVQLSFKGFWVRVIGKSIAGSARRASFGLGLELPSVVL